MQEKGLEVFQHYGVHLSSSSHFRENNNVVAFLFPFHTSMPLVNMWFIALKDSFLVELYTGNLIRPLSSVSLDQEVTRSISDSACYFSLVETYSTLCKLAVSVPFVHNPSCVISGGDPGSPLTTGNCSTPIVSIFLHVVHRIFLIPWYRNYWYDNLNKNK